MRTVRAGLIVVLVLFTANVSMASVLPLPLIYQAASDDELTQLVIYGTNFKTATGPDPTVKLGGVPLTVVSASATDIVALLPADVEPSSYLLMVFRGIVPSLPFEVALGQQGPKGDKGDKGDNGATGAAGPPWSGGPHGRDGANRPYGPYGTDWAHRGHRPHGSPGADWPDRRHRPHGSSRADWARRRHRRDLGL